MLLQLHGLASLGYIISWPVHESQVLVTLGHIWSLCQVASVQNCMDSSVRSSCECALRYMSGFKISLLWVFMWACSMLAVNSNSSLSKVPISSYPTRTWHAISCTEISIVQTTAPPTQSTIIIAWYHNMGFLQNFRYFSHRVWKRYQRWNTKIDYKIFQM